MYKEKLGEEWKRVSQTLIQVAVKLENQINNVYHK